MNNIHSVIQADCDSYAADFDNFKKHYLIFPRKISIETQVVCNAKCTFCPYPTSPRQGQILKEELFYKIIKDLTCIPSHHKFDITLHRINEPLLEGRMEAFCREIAEKLPNANQKFFSNGLCWRKVNLNG